MPKIAGMSKIASSGAGCSENTSRIQISAPMLARVSTMSCGFVRMSAPVELVAEAADPRRSSLVDGAPEGEER